MQTNLIHIGLDVGSVSVKLAAWIPRERARDFEVPSDGSVRFSIHREAVPSASGFDDHVLLISEYARHTGEPTGKVSEMLTALKRFLDMSDGIKFHATGSGAKEAAKNFGFQYVNEYRAIAEGMGLLHPEVRTVLEMGGGNSKYIRLNRNGDGSITIEDYETNGECAAGTGLFFDQQVERLEIRVEDVGDLVRKAARSAAIAGRCSVFAKSDMIHAQQRGFTPPEILKGLCESVVRNFKGSILKGRDVVPTAALIGGVSANAGVEIGRAHV
jgi:activator of 2-hydroxyglutaryl-CoA dehydratase